jgi:hypothetical protein
MIATCLSRSNCGLGELDRDRNRNRNRKLKLRLLSCISVPWYLRPVHLGIETSDGAIQIVRSKTRLLSHERRNVVVCGRASRLAESFHATKWHDVMRHDWYFYTGVRS